MDILAAKVEVLKIARDIVTDNAWAAGSDTREHIEINEIIETYNELYNSIFSSHWSTPNNNAE